MGVGLAEGRGGKGVNWRLFAQQFASWVMTLVVVGLGVAAVYAQVCPTPNLQPCPYRSPDSPQENRFVLSAKWAANNFRWLGQRFVLRLASLECSSALHAQLKHTPRPLSTLSVQCSCSAEQTVL